MSSLFATPCHARAGGHPVRRGDREKPQTPWNTGSPAFAGDDGRKDGLELNFSSWHRKAQRFAAAAHVDGGKASRGEAAGAAVALFIGLEFGLARAKLGGAAPVQRPVLELEGTVLGIDSLGETENLLGLTGDIGMQAFAGFDAIPAAADHGLAVVGADGGHDLVRRVVAPGKPGR